MSMPVITPGQSSRKQAITDLITSVALQETAISHILNAEGEKMQAIIAMPNVDTKKLLKLNRNVERLINAITRLEGILHAKLELFSDESCCDELDNEPDNKTHC